MNNDWYERGELPPVGTHCEVTLNPPKHWHECVFMSGFSLINIDGDWKEYKAAEMHGFKIRPLRTETDKLVESLTSVLDEIFSSDRYLGESNKLAAREIIEFLDGYREAEGYRKIKPMSEKEFMKQCVDICYHADTRLYRAGCRFLDQGE